MSDNITATRETEVTLSVQQLENLIRKVGEELIEFAAQELGIFHLDKESPKIWRIFLNVKNLDN